jgi:hypothetical protein
MLKSGENVEKRKCLHTVGRNVNLYRHSRKPYGDFLEKLKVELLSDLEMLWGN